MAGESGKDDKQWLQEKLEEDKRRRRQQLKEARKKAKASGKEAFSFEKLCRLYDPRSDFARPGAKPSPEIRKSMEYKYYVYCPQIMSIKEFVEYLEMMDVYNS